MMQMARTIVVMPLLGFNVIVSKAERSNVEQLESLEQPGQASDMSMGNPLKYLAEALRYPVHMARMGTNGISDVFCTPIPEKFSQGPFHPDARHHCVEPIEYPATGDRTYVSYEAVEELLLDTPLAQAAGIVTRGHELGYIHLGPEFWKYEKSEDAKKIGLGAGAEVHETVRPVFDRVLAGDGMWTEQELEQSMHGWIEEMWWPNTVTEFSADDVAKWSANEMHKLHFGLALDKPTVDQFLSFQKTVLSISILQGVTKANLALTGAMALIDKNKDIAGEREQWLHFYKQNLKGKPLVVIKAAFNALYAEAPNFDLANLQDDFIGLVVKSFLESLLFAGGLSVPTVIKNALAVLHSAHSPLAEMTEQERMQLIATDDGLDQFIMEVIRKYPPVYGFPIYRTVGWADEPKHFIGNVAMALRDPEVFESPLVFNPKRNVTLMRQKIGIAWAEPANGREAWQAVQMNPREWGKTQQLLTEDSHGCPGEKLSFSMIKVFFRRWLQLRKAVPLEVVPESDAEFTDHIGFTPALRFRKVTYFQAPPLEAEMEDADELPEVPRPTRTISAPSGERRGTKRSAEDFELGDAKATPKPQRRRDDDE